MQGHLTAGVLPSHAAPCGGLLIPPRHASHSPRPDSTLWLQGGCGCLPLLLSEAHLCRKVIAGQKKTELFFASPRKEGEGEPVNSRPEVRRGGAARHGGQGTSLPLLRSRFAVLGWAMNVWSRRNDAAVLSPWRLDTSLSRGASSV